SLSQLLITIPPRVDKKTAGLKLSCRVKSSARKSVSSTTKRPRICVYSRTRIEVVLEPNNSNRCHRSLSSRFGFRQIQQAGYELEEPQLRGQEISPGPGAGVAR